MSCSADERAADGMEAMLTRKGESVEFGECKRWFWNNSSLFWIFFPWDRWLRLPLLFNMADFERNFANSQCKTKERLSAWLKNSNILYDVERKERQI